MNTFSIFLVCILSFHESGATLKKENQVFEAVLIEKPKGFAGLKSPESLIQKCESEQESQFSNGSCLMLGIYALKSNYVELFEHMEKLCIQKVRLHQLPKNLESEAFLAYYPKCKYVLDGLTQAKTSENLNLRGELKTLVRFLNN